MIGDRFFRLRPIDRPWISATLIANTRPFLIHQPWTAPGAAGPLLRSTAPGEAHSCTRTCPAGTRLFERPQAFACPRSNAPAQGRKKDAPHRRSAKKGPAAVSYSYGVIPPGCKKAFRSAVHLSHDRQVPPWKGSAAPGDIRIDRRMIIALIPAVQHGINCRKEHEDRFVLIRQDHDPGKDLHQ